MRWVLLRVLLILGFVAAIAAGTSYHDNFAFGVLWAVAAVFLFIFLPVLLYKGWQKICGFGTALGKVFFDPRTQL